MSTERAEHEHISGLLPAFVNGTLEESAGKRVREHVAQCAACQAELDAWEAIRLAAQQSFASVAAPAGLLDRVWAKIDQ